MSATHSPHLSIVSLSLSLSSFLSLYSTRGVVVWCWGGEKKNNKKEILTLAFEEPLFQAEDVLSFEEIKIIQLFWKNFFCDKKIAS
jgi:hypothetical protein